MDHLSKGNPDEMRSSSSAYGIAFVETGVDVGAGKTVQLEKFRWVRRVTVTERDAHL